MNKITPFNLGIPHSNWDATITALGGSVLQSRAWAVFQDSLGNSVYHARGRGEGVGTRHTWAWLAVMRKNKGIRYLYAPYGPIVATPQDLNPALDTLMQAGKKFGADFIRIEPRSKEDLPEELLAGLGARPVPENQPRRTVVLDLTPSEDRLKAGISQSNRSLINGSAARDITITAFNRPTLSQAKAFLFMLDATIAHNGFHPHPPEYYLKTIEILTTQNIATLYLAEIPGQPVAGAVVFDFGDTRYYAHAASFPDLNRRHKAAVPLLWRIITDAKNAGKQAFDFWGIAPTDDPDHPKAGLTRFKLSFGGQVQTYPGTWEIPVKNVKYGLYHWAKGFTAHPGRAKRTLGQ